MRIALTCLVAFLCVVAPSWAQTVPDTPTRTAMVAVFNKILDVETRSNAIVRPAEGTPNFSATCEARDQALDKLRVELVKVVSPQANAIQLPPFNGQDAGSKATHVTHASLRDLISLLNGCIAQRQQWICTGRRGGLAAVQANMEKQYARYNTARDAIRKALLGR